MFKTELCMIVQVPFTSIGLSFLKNFKFTDITFCLPAALGPGVYSASNRNEYQKQKNKNVCGE
jgi:hypothetical protein